MADMVRARVCVCVCNFWLRWKCTAKWEGARYIENDEGELCEDNDEKSKKKSQVLEDVRHVS